MDVPSGFKRWRFHWFQCPACRHRANRAYWNVTVSRQPPRVVWRFWCERCGAYSTLGRPMMPALAGGLLLFFLLPVAAAALALWVALVGPSMEWLIVLFAAFWLSSPLVFLGLTRLMYRYVPVAQ